MVARKFKVGLTLKKRKYLERLNAFLSGAGYFYKAARGKLAKGRGASSPF